MNKMNTYNSNIQKIAEDALLFRTWSELLHYGSTSHDAIETLVDTYPQYKVSLISLDTWFESHNYRFKGFSSKEIEGSFGDQRLFSSPTVRKMLILQDERGGLEDYLLNLSKHLELEVECSEKHFSKKQTSKILFYDTLRIFINYGFPLLLGLKETSDCCSFPPERVNKGIIRKSIKGATLAEALSKYPKYFSRLDTQMIRCGEMGGVLEKTLTELIDIYKTKYELEGRKGRL